MAETMAGRRIIQTSWAGTAVFAVTAIAAAIVLGPIRFVAVGVALGLFAVGCVLFLTAYWIAVQRSRTDEIGIGGLYFVAGKTAPRPVQRHLNGSLLAQVVIALATAFARPYTTLAFGILVPVFGLGCTGLWASRYGMFGPRRRPDAASPDPESVPPDAPNGEQIGQNAPHG